MKGALRNAKGEALRSGMKRTAKAKSVEKRTAITVMADTKTTFAQNRSFRVASAIMRRGERGWVGSNGTPRVATSGEEEPGERRSLDRRMAHRGCARRHRAGWARARR